MAFSQHNWEDFTALNQDVIKALKQAGFVRPTKIQAQVLQQFLHYYDFLIASQTGSGKTLGFSLPILSDIVDFCKSSSLEEPPQILLGLIVTPTRQLAQQIEQNLKQLIEQMYCKISVVSIIGGMSKQKQVRIIRQRKPHIIIGTPGRIYQFLQDQVFNFEFLKYLVIDEADRMIELGHFVQVDKILSKIFTPKLQEFYEKDFLQITSSIANKDLQKKENALFFMQGNKKLKFNFDLHSIEADKLFEVPMELFSFVHGDGSGINEKMQSKNSQIQIKQNIQKSVNLFRQPTQQEIFHLNKLKRRIFFVSATLTRQFKGQKYSIKRKRQEAVGFDQKNKKLKKDRSKKNNRKQDLNSQEQNPIENIPKLKALLSRVNFSSKPKIIDQSSEFFLPVGLTERVSFTDGEAERISMIVCYIKSLSSTAKTIIFGNTIKVSKRIQFFLSSLGYKISNLHSHMEQKQRLLKLERFKKSQNINILVATDVAARGLDFSVTNVIQYGVPINGDTYVHRAGRTARAGGKGESLIVVDRKQGQKWSEINDILNSSVPGRRIDKFIPSKILMDQIEDKINQLQWIRVNNERQKDVRKEKLEQLQADQLGVEPEEEEAKGKSDMNREEEQIVRQQLKKKVQKIKKETSKSHVYKVNGFKWKKNKLILSPDEIIKMM